MNATTTRLSLGLAACVAGCGDPGVAAVPTDATDVEDVRDVMDATDVARTDASQLDVGRDVALAMDVGRPDAGTPDAGTADAGTADVVVVTEPDFEAIPWSAPGLGVAYRDSENPRGHDVFIGYAGYGVDATRAQSWVTRLYRDALRERGVRHVYAVQGPREAGYDSQEIGNSRLIAHLLPRLATGASILVAAHSSGAFVAHELLGQLYERGLDPSHLTANRLSYWDLDGGSYGLNASIVGQLRHAWFVWAEDAATATRSPNAGVMIAAGATYARAGGALRLDASASGCNRGATWCVHMAPITTRPHDPARANVALDYGSFDAEHRVETAWLTRTAFGAP